MEEKILSMYAQGMTAGHIENHMQEHYGVDISDSTISQITSCRERMAGTSFGRYYAVVFMDAIHFHVRSEGWIIKKLFISPLALI